MSILSKIFGDPNERMVARYWPIVEEINKLEKQFEALSDTQLKEKTEEFRKRLAENETADDLLPEAFAATREASKRTLGQRHFDVQLIGGIVLHQGKIAEMKTGEGKTLASTLAVYLNALEGKGVHVITVNDYLAKRDTNWMGPIYWALGLSVGCIVHEKAYLYEPQAAPDKNEVTIEMQNLKEVPRQEAYNADITYGTNNEFGFDYLRDNMVADLSEAAQRGHNFAIVDEVDSILIDEARTPLIISAPDAESTKLYETFSKIVPKLKENEDYNIDEKMRAATLTEQGIAKVEQILGMDIYNEGGIRYVHHLEQALRAHVLFKLDRNYVVKDGEVIIVDDFTGRLMFGRRYSEGLHQAIEAKEGVRVQQESRTLATITFQNYFRMYKKLAGMTGTAVTSAEEFSKVYKLEVVVIPTNKPMIRENFPDSIYRTEKGKFEAVIREIKQRYKKGQPVLVGTVSIEKNERLSALLKKEGIPQQVLNAKNHEQEAQIIAQAGRVGAVTVATNMAGRGVDIILGGRPKEGVIASPANAGRSLPTGDLPKGDNPVEDSDVNNSSGSPRRPAGCGAPRDDTRDDWQQEHDKVVELGGLHIIGTERHEARRIDNQLRGRSGRQGDPGSSQFFVSLEDDLMRIFGSDRIKRMMEVLKVPEDQPIENKMISKAIEAAQAKIEGYNFDIRKHVLEYDDVMNKQRERIYRWRREILEANLDAKKNVETKDNANEGVYASSLNNSPQPPLKIRGGAPSLDSREGWGEFNLRQRILDAVQKEIRGLVEFHTAGDKQEWNLKEICEAANTIFPLPQDASQKLAEFKEREEIINYLIETARQAYEAKEKEIGPENMRQIEKLVMLRMIDMLWMNHLDDMDHLRDSVRLRAYGQKDPLVEYKNEGHRLFQRLIGTIESSVARTIYKVGLVRETPRYERPLTQARESRPAGAPASQSSHKDIGRNDPCPCGKKDPVTGRPIKYKRCCYPKFG